MDKRVFGLILGQCSRTVRDRIEAAATWEAINEGSDTMGLLRIIRQSLFSGATTRKNVHSKIDAATALYKFKQGDQMTNSEYLEKLKGLVEVFEHFGGQPGIEQDRIDAHITAADAANPTDAEIAAAKVLARDEYMASMLLIKSDPKRYGALTADIENNHTRGNDTYPSTLSRAYDMLINYRSPTSNQFQTQDGGLSFYTDGEGGRGGRGRGRGRGGRGRGRNARTRENTDQDDQAHVNAEDGDSSGVVDNDEVAPSVEGYIHDYTLATLNRTTLPDRWLLLDSCSSTDLIANDDLLTSIPHLSTH